MAIDITESFDPIFGAKAGAYVHFNDHVVRLAEIVYVDDDTRDEIATVRMTDSDSDSSITLTTSHDIFALNLVQESSGRVAFREERIAPLTSWDAVVDKMSYLLTKAQGLYDNGDEKNRCECGGMIPRGATICGWCQRHAPWRDADDRR